jgi:hypothetical protein
MHSYCVWGLVATLRCASAQGTSNQDSSVPELATPTSLESAVLSKAGHTKAFGNGNSSASAAAPAPSLAYDLASDLEARRQEAQRDLGRRVSIEVVEDVFLIAIPDGQGKGAVRTAELAMAAYFNGRFTRRPERAISVYLFPSAKPYQAYCRLRWARSCISSYGFYESEGRHIVLDLGPGVGTLTHELVHPIMKTDFPDAPIWFEEGIASLYEGFGMGKRGDIRGVKNWRLPALVAAMNQPKQRQTVRIDTLFSMSYETFRGDDESLNYALARYFCLWLEQKGLLWPFYHAWRNGFASDATGEKAFLAVVGTQPSEANAGWQRWLRQL